MDENYENEEEKSSLENIGEAIQKNRSRNVHRPHNPIKSKSSLGKIATQKTPLSKAQTAIPKLPQKEDNSKSDTSFNLDDKMSDVPQKVVAVANFGISLFSKKTWIILAASLSVFFFLAIVIFMVFLVENSSEFGYDPDESSPNVDYHMLYEEIDDVVTRYKNEYGVEIDKYLIISVLTSYKDNYEYSNETTTDLFDYVEGTNTLKATAMIEVLAKYQIKTNAYCDKDSSTMRKIASNDDVLGVTNFWTSEVAREKNYSCSLTTQETTYELSTEQGSIDNENSGSTFYWNLIDEGFFKEYYPNYFASLTGESYEQAATKTLDYMYQRANSLRESSN